MTTRTFIFCDICNPQGLRNLSVNPENKENSGKLYAWFEGHVDQAAKLGWGTTDKGLNLCPRCVKKKNNNKS